MKLTVKYHGELIEYFPDSDEEKNVSINAAQEDSILTIIERYSIPSEKINLILVNGVKVDDADFNDHRFADGDILAIWPITPKE
jgi:molybdopterin converting factor small subunit